MILLLGFSVVHIAAFSWLTYYWIKTASFPAISPSNKSFTVLIPVRNEAANIQKLLLEIHQQSYPRKFFEVIVVDDYSEDDTVSIVQSLIPKVGFSLKCISDQGLAGKKSALTRGVQHAKHEYILTVDGDCSVGRDWIAAYASAYEKTNAVMITGPVSMTGKGFLPSMQSVEFASLIGFGAAALKSGNPSMCNGANMSYMRSVFAEVEGYQGNEQIPSGDDEFLLQKVFGKYPHQIHFLKSTHAIVKTSAKETLANLVNQRVRWSSKWKFHKSWFVKISAVMAFLDFMTVIAVSILTFFGQIEIFIFFGVMAVRWVVDTTYLYAVGSFFKISAIKIVGISLLLQIIYPVFVSLLGIASIFGKYSWKGRNYR